MTDLIQDDKVKKYQPPQKPQVLLLIRIPPTGDRDFERTYYLFPMVVLPGSN